MLAGLPLVLLGLPFYFNSRIVTHTSYWKLPKPRTGWWGWGLSGHWAPHAHAGQDTVPRELCHPFCHQYMTLKVSTMDMHSFLSSSCSPNSIKSQKGDPCTPPKRSSSMWCFHCPGGNRAAPLGSYQRDYQNGFCAQQKLKSHLLFFCTCQAIKLPKGIFGAIINEEFYSPALSESLTDGWSFSGTHETMTADAKQTHQLQHPWEGSVGAAGIWGSFSLSFSPSQAPRPTARSCWDSSPVFCSM